MKTSIRRRLLIRLLIALGCCSALVGWAMFIHARGEMVELFDETIVQVAYALSAKVEHAKSTVHEKERRIRNEEDFLLQIWSPSADQPLYTSHPSIPFPLQQEEGIQTVVFKDQQWRTVVVKSGGEIIQVAQPLTNRVAMKTALEFLIPVLLQIPLLSFLIWFVVGRSLGPLTVLSNALQNRSPRSMKPLDLEKAPAEMTPVIHALNDLLQRLGEAMALQRRFIADSAHELRTPLTALRLQMDNLNHAETDKERKLAQEELSKGIERSIHLAQQLLVLFREDPEAGHPPKTVLELTSLIRGCVARWSPQAQVRHIEILYSPHEPQFIEGHEQSMEILIGNLIDNAIRYAAEAGKVVISTALAANGDLVMAVEDTGPGIAPVERERIFQRFYRIPGTKQRGSGLGLAIVKAIADRHQAKVSVHAGSRGRGARFVVVFPKNTLPSVEVENFEKPNTVGRGMATNPLNSIGQTP